MGAAVAFLFFFLCAVAGARHHDHRTPKPHPTPSPEPLPPPSPSAAADSHPPPPLPIVQACGATRFPALCMSSLSSSSSTTPAAIAADAFSFAARTIPAAAASARDLLAVAASRRSANLTNAATNCVAFLSLASHRVAAASAALSLSLPYAGVAAGAAILHQYDCWSAYKYANETPAVGAAMVYLDGVSIPAASNAAAIVAAIRRYGADGGMSDWAPQQTERDGYWPDVTPGNTDVERLGVPDLPPNVTVCGAGGGCDFETVQAAVDAAPELGKERFVVKVKEGVYKEMVRVAWEKTNVVLVGDGTGKTVITGDLNADTAGISTYNTATVGVHGDGFMARDLTIANTAGPDRHQAVAFRSSGDGTVLDSVELLGHQDTLYAHAMRQFYTRCRVSGTVDFVFGNSAALFYDTTLLLLPRQLKPDNSENDAVTAQGRTDPDQPTGLVFHGCVVNGSAEFLEHYLANPAAHRVYLGRPWKEFSRTVYVGCTMAEIVRPEGWMPWTGDFALKTLYYGEYDSQGPGGRSDGRVRWSSQVPAERLPAYDVDNFIQGGEWIPVVS